MKIAFTGHRPHRLSGKEKEIAEEIYRILKILNDTEYIEAVYSGMAQGADQLAALQAIKIGLPLYCAYPYRRGFCPQEEYINDAAVRIEFISEKYSKNCFAIRDKYMVNHCDLLIAIWDGESYGGTYETMKYAKKQGKRILCISTKAFDSKDGE